jgi:O-antigen/teichoic acid export membrane protein
LFTAFGLGANYLFGIYVARKVGAESFGLYSIGLSIFNMLATLSVMGLNSAVLHFVPGAWALGYQRAARSALRNALRLGFLVGCVTAIGLIIVSAPLSHRVFADAALLYVLPFFAAAIPAYAVGTVLLSGLQALHDVKWRMLVKYASEPAVKFTVTVPLIWVGWELYGVLTGFAVALCASAILAWLALHNRMAAGPPTRHAPEDREVNTLAVARYASPLLAGMFFNVIASRSDVLLIGYFLPASEAGVYAAALMTAGIIAIVLQSVESITAARLSESLAQRRIAETRIVYCLSLRWAVILGTPLVLVFILWPAEILEVFGSSFGSGAAAFVILTLAQFLNLATGSANQILLLSGRSRSVMFNEIVNGTLQIGLNIYLIPRYGIAGAAMGLLVAVMTVNALRLMQVWRYVGIHPYDWALVKPLAAAAVAYGATLAVAASLARGLPLLLVLVTLAGYAISLLTLGLHPQDRSALASLSPLKSRLNPPQE